MGKIKYWLIAGFIILLSIVYTAISDRDSKLSRLKSAGENGDVEAQYALGLMYLHGEILDVDYQQAKIWYEKAADQSDPRAQAKLGVMYANGLGVNQDYQQSKSWFEKAAEQGYVDAQYNLGVIYENGEGVSQDFHQARVWYEKAAVQNDVQAQFDLGVMNERSVVDNMSSPDAYSLIVFTYSIKSLLSVFTFS
ncbi:sel1 repeat family protein [Klebsiella pneumoniae]|nr:sel1 repeat family protein [Klebsiella pneumoniae]